MAPSDLVVSPVATKADLKEFIRLPRRLYAGHKGWVAPLNVERQEAFSPKKNPLFQHAEVQFFLARRNGQVVGRISAQVDSAYLAQYADSTGQFGCLVAEDDPAIFAALFAAAEAWLKAKGMVRVTGPFTLSVNEEVGLLVEGFDVQPAVGIGVTPARHATFDEDLDRRIELRERMMRQGGACRADGSGQQQYLCGRNRALHDLVLQVAGHAPRGVGTDVGDEATSQPR